MSQYWYESVDTGFKPGRLVALQRNARILVDRTLEVKKGQQVCIVADTEVSPLLAWTVAGEVAAAGGIPSVVSWEANARPGMDVPAPVGAALLAADAIVACVSRSISFSKAIQEAYLVRGIPYVVMSNATEDMLMLVPDTLREAAASIGLPRAHMIVRIAYRAAQAGIVTGILLAVARISGETAPLLFTALNNQFFSMDMNAPMPSLPVVIFQFALSPYAEWQKLAWTGALLITVTVLGLSILARSLTSARKS